MDPAVYRQAVQGWWEKSRVFPVQKHPWGAASLGQDIQKCVCVRGSSLVPLDSAELSFVLGTAVGFCLSPFCFEVTFFSRGCVKIAFMYQKAKETSSWFRKRDSLG